MAYFFMERKLLYMNMRNYLLNILGKSVDNGVMQLENNGGPIISTFFPELANKKIAYDYCQKVIEKNELLSDAEKIVLLSERKQLMNELKNKFEIADLADKLLGDTDLERVKYRDNIKGDIEWFSRFFDQAKYIELYEKQLSWASILAQKVTEPKEVPISVIRILSEITEDQAEGFSIVCSHTLKLLHKDSIGKYVDLGELLFLPYIDKKKNSEISFELLYELERIGLLNFSSKTGYSWATGKEDGQYAYYYKGEKLGDFFLENQCAMAGAVFLTNAGKCIEKIVKKNPISGYLENVKEYMLERIPVEYKSEVKIEKFNL